MNERGGRIISACRLLLAACRLPFQQEKHARPRSAGQAGFTLIEVVMAVVILGLAYVAVLQNFSFSLSSILRLEERKRHTLAASQEIDALLRASGKNEEAALTVFPTFLEGSTYRLVLLASDDGALVSLRLLRR